MNKIVSLFFLPFVFFKVILKPIINIGIWNFDPNALGHINEDTIVYKRFNKMFSKSLFNLDLFLLDKKTEICNEFLFAMWKRVLIILPAMRFLKKIMILEQRLFGKKIKNKHDLYFRACSEFKNPLYFTEREKESAINYLYDLGLKKNQKWICIANRESNYFVDIYNKSGEVNKIKNELKFNECRNFDVEIFEKPIQRFIDEGFFIFRLGKKTKKKLEINDKNFLDLSLENSYQNDFIQIFLLANCELTICGSNGVTSIPQIFNRDVCVLNNYDILFRHMYQFWQKTPYLPKLIYEKKTKKIIHLKDYKNFGLIHSDKTNPPFFVDINKFFYQDNSYDEVDNLFKEIIEKKFKNKKYTKDEINLQKQFFASVKSNLEEKYYKNLNIEYGTPGIYFLKKNLNFYN